ncbi:opsin, ultraviolet-sensitive-like [Oratosquilla oratoria]|uniref:opsin, ultraviolet-sensitive-like n=1 Tax=Oratosquilla oratoria TaxID=337810 RepID=UPI003F766EE8
MIHPHWRRFEPPPASVNLAFGALYGLIGLVGVVANLVNLAIFCRYLWTSSNLLISNLAVFDVLMMIKTPIFVVNSAMQGPFLGATGCQMYGALSALSGLGSIWTLTAVAYERYLAISHPFRHTNRFSLRQAGTLLILSWFLGFVFMMFPLMGWNRFVFEGFLTSCTFDYLSEDWSSRSYVITIVVFAWFFPMIVIVSSYVSILLTIRESHRQLATVAGDHKPSSSRGRQVPSLRVATAAAAAASQDTWPHYMDAKMKLERRLTRKTAVIVLVWVLAWTPYAVIVVCSTFLNRDWLTPKTCMIPAICCKISACMNPFLYGFKRSQERRLRARRGMMTGSLIDTMTNVEFQAKEVITVVEMDETVAINTLMDETVAITTQVNETRANETLAINKCVNESVAINKCVSETVSINTKI